eukprot:gene2460-2764_t
MKRDLDLDKVVADVGLGPGLLLGLAHGVVPALLLDLVRVAFGSGFRYSMGAVRGQEGQWLSALLTGVVLSGITVYALVTHPSGGITVHYFCIAMYALFTGIVEFARFNFDASRFGFLTASWHNLWEYHLIAYLLLSPADAKRWTPRILLFVWVLDLWIMFVPSLDGVLSGVFWAALPEQLTGICADWVLVLTMLYLTLASREKPPAFVNTAENPKLHTMFKYGAAAAAMHMAEIIPLVLLLAGLTPRPYLPISIIVSLTSPITFILYTKKILAISILIGLSTILGPIIAIPDCPYGQPSATGRPELSALTKPLLKLTKVPVSNFATPEETAAAVAARQSHLSAWPTTNSSGNGGTQMMSCPSKSVLRGVTVVSAKPHHGGDLRTLVAPMAYSVRKEEGSLVWDLAYDQKIETVVVTETWSNIRTLLKHVYTSPTVRSVFYGKEFAHVVQKQSLEGPFAAMLSCKDVAAEPDKLDFRFEVTLDAPVECAWNNMKNWTRDFAYVHGAKGVSAVLYNRDLRILHMTQGFNITVLRHPATSSFLPPIEQPAHGHRFVYYVLDGEHTYNQIDRAAPGVWMIIHTIRLCAAFPSRHPSIS